MEEHPKQNAKEIGIEATVDSLKELLVTQFKVAPDTSQINPSDPLFSAGIGLSSIEGLELLAVLERKFGVVIRDLDQWVDESPTLEGVARYLVENSPTGEAS